MYEQLEPVRASSSVIVDGRQFLINFSALKDRSLDDVMTGKLADTCEIFRRSKGEAWPNGKYASGCMT